jgi:CheY-like chemotaxis protein
LAVRDTGIGIEPNLLARIFEPFMQGDLSLERSRGGLGLGLALVKGLVELHGGEVSAASGGVNQGAEFRLWLPCVEKLAARPTERLTTALRGPKLRILLVEDNRDSAESLKLLLEHVGHVVTMAESGTEALAHARGQIPDVVLCDLALPGMSGFEVAESLRAEHGTSPLVVVAISGHGSDGDQEQTRAAGFALHMTKPIDFGVLLKFLASVKKPD